MVSRLRDAIEELGPGEHEGIYSFLIERGVDMSLNVNGAFVNLSTLDDDTVALLQDMCAYMSAQNAQLDAHSALLQRTATTGLDAVLGGDSDQPTEATVTREERRRRPLQACSPSSAEQTVHLAVDRRGFTIKQVPAFV